jgi:hypothetical protein
MSKQIYLNAADGRKEAVLGNKTIRTRPSILAQQYRTYLAELYHTNPSEWILGQNVTSHVVRIISQLLTKRPNFTVFISSHEIIFFKEALEKGRLEKGRTTYPNYAPFVSFQFPKVYPKIFNAKDVLNIEKVVGKKPSIVILSHVSRLTGEIFPIKDVYVKLKKLNSKNVLIVDGVQFTGTRVFGVADACDAYITSNYKFLGAEPSLSAAYCSSSLQDEYSLDTQGILPEEYAKELYSTVAQVKKIKNIQNANKRISSLRKSFLRDLIKCKELKLIIPPHQIPQMVTIYVGSRDKVENTVGCLESKGISVSSNTGYSNAEPTVPCIRVSISFETTKTDLAALIRILPTYL